MDAFCLVPLSLRSAWRRRVAPNLNQKVENAALKITVCVHATRSRTFKKMQWFHVSLQETFRLIVSWNKHLPVFRITMKLYCNVLTVYIWSTTVHDEVDSGHLYQHNFSKLPQIIGTSWSISLFSGPKWWKQSPGWSLITRAVGGMETKWRGVPGPGKEGRRGRGGGRLRPLSLSNPD